MQPRQGRINHQNNSLIHLGPFSSRQRQSKWLRFHCRRRWVPFGLGSSSRFLRKVFKSLIFLLVEHPFDIGDTVIIDKIRYTVSKCACSKQLLRGFRFFNHVHSQHVLFSKYIYNEQRPNNHWIPSRYPSSTTSLSVPAWCRQPSTLSSPNHSQITPVPSV